MAVTISGLSKTYPNGVKALKSVSLSIGNIMFGLLGPNGAGKSTLMRTIATGLRLPLRLYAAFGVGSPQVQIRGQRSCSQAMRSTPPSGAARKRE